MVRERKRHEGKEASRGVCRCWGGKTSESTKLMGGTGMKQGRRVANGVRRQEVEKA
jgi:hypothetical protein